MPEVSDERYAPTYRHFLLEYAQSSLYKHLARVFFSLSPFLYLSPSLSFSPIDRVSTQPFKKDKNQIFCLFVFFSVSQALRYEISCERSSHNYSEVSHIARGKGRQNLSL